jgi:sec-independent protein translocase protein TatB
MFDIGFSELMVIGVVALIVLGPERLPKVARTAGQWIGRAQRYVNEVKADIAREGELAELKALREQIETAGRDVENTIRNESANLSSELSATAKLATDTASDSANTGTPGSAAPAAALDAAQPAAAALETPDHHHHAVPAAAQSELFAAVPGASRMPGDPAHDPQVQRMEAEILSDEITRLEDRLARLRREADALRNMQPQHE